jgi:hypothetical protein
MKKTLFVEIISVLFIILFVYAAASKLIDYQKFRVQLGQSPMLTSYAGIVAWLVPLAEVVIALLLAGWRFRILGLYASFSLMVMFTTYIFLITRFSEFVPCSCGGILEKLSWNQHFVFNIIFVTLAATGVYLYPKNLLRNEQGKPKT